MEGSKNTYITTPIFYVNDTPHIGHCYNIILTDAVARLECMHGATLRIQTGTDEHGQKVHQSAVAKGILPMQLSNQISGLFYKLAITTNCCASYPSFNFGSEFNRHEEVLGGCDGLFGDGVNYIRTSEGRDLQTGDITEESLENGRHIKAVQAFWNKLKRNSWLYKGKYCGWYAIRDEAFYEESEVVDGKAPSGAPVEWREEETYFFKLSKLQELLTQIFTTQQLITPPEKTAEVLAFITGIPAVEARNGKIDKGSLKDLSVSRSNLQWGVPVPDDETHTVYVWIDALTNYYSAIGYPSALAREYWQNSNVIHVLGKDILRFHAVYWPALLIAESFTLDDLSNFDDIAVEDIMRVLPKQLLVHGWWTNKGEKISKSLGNVINPFTEIENIKAEFGTTYTQAVDYLRYFLLTAMPVGNDGNYDSSKIREVINADLCNNVGNLVNRVLSLTKKYCTPENFLVQSSDNLTLTANYNSTLNPLANIQDAIRLSSLANKFVEEHKLWEKAKYEKEFFDRDIIMLHKQIIQIMLRLRFVIPSTTESVLSYIGIPFEKRLFGKESLELVTSTNAPLWEDKLPIFFKKAI